MNFEVECSSKILYQQNTNRHIAVIFIATIVRSSELIKNQTDIAVGMPRNKSVAQNFLGLKPEVRVAHISHYISSVYFNAWFFSV